MDFADILGYALVFGSLGFALGALATLFIIKETPDSRIIERLDAPDEQIGL